MYTKRNNHVHIKPLRTNALLARHCETDLYIFSIITIRIFHEAGHMKDRRNNVALEN